MELLAIPFVFPGVGFNIAFISQLLWPTSPIDLPWENFQKYEAPVSVEHCLARIGTSSNQTITVFVAEDVEPSTLDTYTTYLLSTHPSLDRGDIHTWPTTFGASWLINATSLLHTAHCWIPEARSYYALASRATNDVHLLMPFKKNHLDPYRDGRATPWTSYILPTLTRNPSVSSITVIDPRTFTRRRVVWRRHDATFRRPVNLGYFLSANTADASLLAGVIEKGDPIPVLPYPTVFWSSLCEDTEICLNSSEAVVNHFIDEHLDGKGVHWFTLPSYFGSNLSDIPSLVLAPYLSISSDSPCAEDPGPAAVLEAEMAQGTAYVILKKDVELERASEGVKKTCWWCECELSVLTRNLKVSKIVRVDAQDFGQMRVVWERGMKPFGRDPRLRR